MTNGSLNLDSYFERIKYNGAKSITEQTLFDLHIAHTLNIPFENLDVYYGKPILLDETSLFNKIVKNRRGGYCFEMNGIFSIVLRKMGFRTTNLLARGMRGGFSYSAKTHQVLLVEIGDKRWLVDVGFGNNGILAPLVFEVDTDQKQFAHIYRLIKDIKLGYVLQKKIKGEYINLYSFTMDECYPVDFIMSNHFTATFPESIFIKTKMCTMPTREGRITLTDTYFIDTNNGDVTQVEIANDEEFNEVLKKNFGLDLKLILGEAR